MKPIVKHLVERQLDAAPARADLRRSRAALRQEIMRIREGGAVPPAVRRAFNLDTEAAACQAEFRAGNAAEPNEADRLPPELITVTAADLYIGALIEADMARIDRLTEPSEITGDPPRPKRER